MLKCTILFKQSMKKLAGLAAAVAIVDMCSASRVKQSLAQIKKANLAQAQAATTVELTSSCPTGTSECDFTAEELYECYECDWYGLSAYHDNYYLGLGEGTALLGNINKVTAGATVNTDYEPDTTHSRIDKSECNTEVNSEVVLSCGCRHRNYCFNGCIEYLAYVEKNTEIDGCTSEFAHVCEETIVQTGGDGAQPDEDALGGLLGGVLGEATLNVGGLLNSGNVDFLDESLCLSRLPTLPAPSED